MQETQETKPNSPLGNRLFQMTNGVTIFGAAEIVHGGQNGDEILIKKPFTAMEGMVQGPYLLNVMGNAPAAIQIHPINILWSVPLTEFPDANTNYIEISAESAGLIL